MKMTSKQFEKQTNKGKGKEKTMNATMRSQTMAGALVLAVASVLVCAQSPAQAAVITSAAFSFGFGADVDGPQVWSDAENAGGNTATTIGDFSFAPAPVGPKMSSGGPTFLARTLADGTPSTGVSGYVGPSFSVPITASYNGAAPGDASGTPNYKLMIEITKLSIWGARHPASDGGVPFTLAWDEVTAGHLQTSPSIALVNDGSVATAANFRQLVWDAPDYDTSLALLNDAFTRTFDIPATHPSLDLRYVDGMEIEGRVHLLYNAVPEPGSVALMLAGMGVLFLRRRGR